MDKIEITFKLREIPDHSDEFSPENSYEQTSIIKIDNDLCGDMEYDILGEKFNSFLNQIGFVRTGTTVFMESINEEEYGYLLDCLHEYRSEEKTVTKS